jgi:large subunit ribosomal protein L25
MAQTFAMSATTRDKSGKGAARAARRGELVPAVIYGDKKPPVSINLELRELRRHLAATFYTHLYDLKVGNETHKVIPRDVQFHPVTELPLHVDFLRVSDKTKITASVPVEAIGTEKSPGIKNGGLLNIIYHELEVKCFANQIPEHITVDVSALNIGQAIHLDDIKFPAGVEVTMHDKHATIVSIATPTAMRGKEEEDLTAAPVAAEVVAIKQKSPEVVAAEAAAAAAAKAKDAKKK